MHNNSTETAPQNKPSHCNLDNFSLNNSNDKSVTPISSQPHITGKNKILSSEPDKNKLIVWFSAIATPADKKVANIAYFVFFKTFSSCACDSLLFIKKYKTVEQIDEKTNAIVKNTVTSDLYIED